MLARKYFSCPPTLKNSPQKLRICRQILHISLYIFHALNIVLREKTWGFVSMIFPELTFLRTVLGKSSILNRICAIKLNEPDARNTQRVWLSAQRSLGTASYRRILVPRSLTVPIIFLYTANRQIKFINLYLFSFLTYFCIHNGIRK